ncbi:uncharacterized protein LOC113465144, partial [Ceratina calcarata]|uniref:Uncharacterized protein LOC113465144 n=1 Tax=Ceratina calcarata TaxID=156304 RepID=A0AAJ7SBC6_9HYME
MGVWIYLLVVVTIIGAIVTPGAMPNNAVYPFRIDYEPVRTIISINHCIVGFQCAAHLNLNIQTALLIFFSAARFEILMIKMRNVNDTALLAMYMTQYHDIKRFAREVITA